MAFLYTDSGSRDSRATDLLGSKGQQSLKKTDPSSKLTAPSERKLDVFVPMLLWGSVGRSARQSAHANR